MHAYNTLKYFPPNILLNIHTSSTAFPEKHQTWEEKNDNAIQTLNFEKLRMISNFHQ